MTSQIPFNVDDFLLSEVQDIDFDEFEDDQLFALIAEYGTDNHMVASFAMNHLVARARQNEALKARVNPVLAKILQEGKVDELVFASALDGLYRLDRQQGQAEIVRLIDTCDGDTLDTAADLLGYDIELYAGEPEFDQVVRKVLERLKQEARKGRALTDAELYFLKNAGWPMIPRADQ